MALRDFTKEKFDIIIQAGQSNSDGTAFGNVDNPYQPDGRVWYLNGDFTIMLAQEWVALNAIQSNYSLSFARKYIGDGRLAEDRKLLILRTSVGGTGFLDNHWKMTDDLYLRMMEMIRTALALNPENKLVALLWHQGETDAGLGATYDQHYKHLMTLLTSVREEFAAPALPFVCGDFVKDWKSKNEAICAPVIDAIKTVCRNAAPAAFVETADLASNREDGFPHPFGWVDDIHFSRQSIYILGERYYEAFAELVK